MLNESGQDQALLAKKNVIHQARTHNYETGCEMFYQQSAWGQETAGQHVYRITTNKTDPSFQTELLISKTFPYGHVGRKFGKCTLWKKMLGNTCQFCDIPNVAQST